MLIDRRSWPQHRPWVVLIVVVTAAAAAWYVIARFETGEWPGGSSLPGFSFGVAGGLLIVFEFLLWGRKKVRTWRIGRAQVWMRAHIWLGLLVGPLAVLHCGFRLGGTLSTWLLALVAIVIASGVWGLALQQFLPRKMLNDVPAETIYSQIGHLVAQYREDAARLVAATCGPAPGEEAAEARAGAAQVVATIDAVSHLTVGAVRSVGRVQGKVLLTKTPGAPVPGSEPLRVFFRDVVVPFLRDGAKSGSPLRSSTRAAALFGELRTRLDPAAHETVDALESLCEQRRQLDAEARIHFWLHSWLWIHLPLSTALLVLLFVHVWVALKYW